MLRDEPKTPTVAIIGAGFSGICLAGNLYQKAKSPLRIIIFGTPMTFGKGLAYSTLNPIHILNVRAKNMSAFSDNSDHFVEWLKLHVDKTELKTGSGELKEEFIPRYLYGGYLQDILNTMTSPSASGCSIELITANATRIVEFKDHLILENQEGNEFRADTAVFAHGHIPPKFPFHFDNSISVLENPWDYESYQVIPKDSSVLILGTGLTMIDAVLQLKSQGHSGKIIALSRHGLIPKTQLEETAEYIIDEKTLSLNLKDLIKFTRKEINNNADNPIIQQAILKAIRLKVNPIWKSFSLREKRQFLRHCLPYWDTERHRIPPQISEYLNLLTEEKSLEIIKGRLLEIKNGAVIFLKRKQTNPSTSRVQTIINCTGPGKYQSIENNPIIESLLSQGLAVVHDLQLGLKVSPNGALINTANIASDRLYTLGPPSKGTLFECTAVKEISQQSTELANLLLKRVTS